MTMWRPTPRPARAPASPSAGGTTPSAVSQGGSGATKDRGQKERRIEGRNRFRGEVKELEEH